MRWYKRLRWRLIGSQFLVAAVGVAIMIIAMQIILSVSLGRTIRPNLSLLIANPDLITEVEASLLTLFRNATLWSLVAAATGAIIVGAITSSILWRTLVIPLRGVARSSQRVADGRYSERVDIPRNSGEAMQQVAVNFNQMAAALEEVEQKRITLIGNVTHELRTPLASLTGYIEGLSDGLFEPNKETFDVMEAEISRLSRLVEDIQTLSRVESGAIHLNLHRFLLSEIVGRVFTQLRPQAMAKDISLDFKDSAEVAWVHADPDRTAQVLTNLISNAIRFTPESGEITATVGLLPKKRAIRLAISDSGIGIPAEDLPYVFERFYRVDHSRSRQTGGSGVGLTISRHLAWTMGGDLRAESLGRGQGATFILTLPTAG